MGVVKIKNSIRHALYVISPVKLSIVHVLVIATGVTLVVGSVGNISHGCGYPKNPPVPSLTDQESDKLTEMAYKSARSVLSGGTTAPRFPGVFDAVCNEVYVLFRVEGDRMEAARAQRDNLAESVYAAGQKAIRENTCQGTMKCYGDVTADEIDRMTAEVFILGERTPIPDTEQLTQDRMDFGGPFMPGLHTIRVATPKREATYVSDVPIQGNLDTPDLFSRLCEKKLGMSADCVTDPATRVSVYQTLHLMRPDRRKQTETIFRGTVLDTDLPTLNDVRQARTKMMDWLLRNIKENGSFTYKYYLGNGTYPDSNNMIRQLMASRLLAEMARESPEYRAEHRRNLEHIFSHWYREDDGKGYIYFDDKSKLGAMAMTLRTIVASPFFAEYQNEAKKLVRTIRSLQSPDGSFRPWYIEPAYDFDADYLMTFYSGEAILALAEYYTKTSDPGILNAAEQAQRYYIEKYVDNIEKNYYPAYVPWHTMSLYELYRITGDAAYPDAVFRLNNKLLHIQQERTPEVPQDTWGRFFDPRHREYGLPHSASDGIYLEGLAYAYRLARDLDKQEYVKTYGNAIRRAATNIIQLQFSDGDMYYLSYPGLVRGAIKASARENYIRIDTTQHAIDAFTIILESFAADEFNRLK